MSDWTTMIRKHAAPVLLSRALMLLLASWCVLLPVPLFGSDTGPICTIDLGSTNFKLIIGEMKNGSYVQHRYVKDKLSVGADMSETTVISEAKLTEIRQTLLKYLSICDQARVPARSAVATAAFREADNRRKVEEIAASLRLPLQILSAKRESELAYLVGTLGTSNFAVIDNGSRSIELVTHGQDGYRWSVFNLGYDIAFRRFFRPARNFAEARENYRRALARYLFPAGFMKNRNGYVGVGLEHLVRKLLSLARADNVSISLDAVSRNIAVLKEMPDNEFATLKQLKNSDAILPRLVVLEQTLATFAYREMQVFERELGTGLIIEKGIPRAYPSDTPP
jgi:exopolyphosphatase/pppGpp-phosphohydrolase